MASSALRALPSITGCNGVVRIGWRA